MGEISDQIVQACAPYVYLFPYATHNDPAYQPCTVDYFLANVQLSAKPMDAPSPQVSRPPVDQTLLATAAPGSTLAIPNDPHATSPVRLGNFTVDPTTNTPSVPAYVHILPVAGTSDVFDIQYWFLYAVRGRSTVFVEAANAIISHFDLQGPAKNGQYTDGYQGMGEHQGDWKFVTVRVTLEGQIQAVFYSQHNLGVWRMGSDVPLHGTQPVVYSARNTHSCFPQAGQVPQINANKTIAVFGKQYGVGLLEWTEAGPVWDCAKNSLVVCDDTAPPSPDTQPLWLSYQGQWAPSVTQQIDPSTFPSLPPTFDTLVTTLVQHVVPNPSTGAATPRFQNAWGGNYAVETGSPARAEHRA